MEYKVQNDIHSICEILNCSNIELANELGIDNTTLSRIVNGEVDPSSETLEAIYNFAYENNIKFNELKEMLYKEEAFKGNVVLFHGSRSGINGPINLRLSRDNNDFGPGFYLGESMKQSISFVSKSPSSSEYIFSFNTRDLKSIKYDVNRDWMLTIAYFRNTLKNYKDTKIIQKLISKLDGIDYIIAPIADNRMFQIINNFIQSDITDEQCKHCLAATNLGYQYVLISDKAIKNLKLLEHCYIPSLEKHHHLIEKEEFNKLAENKVKLARIEYRGKGKYIDEILK